MPDEPLDLGLDLHVIARRHTAALFDCWSTSTWTPIDLAGAVQSVFDRDVEAVAWLAGANKPSALAIVRERYALAFADAWGMLQATVVLQ